MRPAALLLLPSLLALLAHGLSSETPITGEGQATGIKEMDGELTAAPTPEQPDRGVHFVTTAPTLKLLNHHPLLEEFLQEGLDRSEEALRPALPFQPDSPTPFTPSPLPRLANQDSRPVFTSPTPAVAAAPTQPHSREKPWNLDSESPELHITSPLPPGPSMAVPTLHSEDRPSTTPTSRTWTPTQEGPGDMGRPWVPEVMSQTTGLGIEGTVATSPASGDDEETTTTTTTIITTTITTVQPPGPCSWNFSGPEGSLDSPTAPSSPSDVGLDCFYYISVYPGYGVEIKVSDLDPSRAKPPSPREGPPIGRGRTPACPALILLLYRLRIGSGDLLTIYDGDDLTARVLGQYSGPRGHFKLFTSMADVTIQFQSDPGTSVLGYQQGFVIHFFEVPRNDTCPELPEIPNGWKSPSQPELVHGTVVTYQCYPGYQVVGSSILMCQWDLSWSEDLPSCQRVTSCRDPGDVEHSRRLVSSPKFPVGATVQYICDQGFVLTGSAILTCHDRQAGSPKWSDRAPKCLLEQFKPCHGLSAPENGARSPEKRLHPAGATIHFSCAPGYVLKGQASIKCVPGHPSHWSDPPPICRAASLDGFYNGRSLDVAKAPATSSALDAAHMAAAIFLPLVAMVLLVGGVYLYFSRLQGKSPLQLPRTHPRPYNRITVESAFDNPTYETGETREYEVSI
ncbi:seizure protein 6 homolog [Onychomys torridus]|uniref:seizure protein 6 homolog n=1 Tax=Onychomys torridus TaxID=38674 RepID=UPI00167F7B0B|nr:seizure protein 6 homolog [Onychomys torridus]